MKTIQIFLAIALLLFASSPQPIALTPPAVPVPANLFGMHIHYIGTTAPWPTTPWPPVGIPAWRLWDARVTWPDLEPNKGEWHFAILDKCMAMAEQHHVDVLMTLGLTPRWASARPQEPSGYQPGFAAEPSNLEDWRTFVRTVATRYKGRIHAYEIWNEPNIRRFWTGDTDQLIALTREAHDIIKGIDPTAIIVSPAAAGIQTGVRWTAEFLQKGGGQYVDVVGYHFYGPKAPEDMVPLVQQVRRAMADNGAGNLPVWNTEGGWGDHFQSPEAAAAFVVRFYVLLWAAGVQRAYWYSWDHTGSGTIKLIDTESQTLTPAGRAYTTIQNWLVGARMDWCEADTSSTWRCQLRRKNKLEWIVWNPGQTQAFTIPQSWRVKTITPLFEASRPRNGFTVDIGQVPLLMAN